MALRSCSRLRYILTRQAYLVSKSSTSTAQDLVSGWRQASKAAPLPAAPSSKSFSRPSYGLAESEVAPEFDTYHVNVVTGNVRGAGTPSTAWIQLIGAEGQSDKYVIGDSSDAGFQRGSRKQFDMPVPKGIGPLRRVFIERDASRATEVGSGWFLQQVEVRGPDGQLWLFPCHSWLGESDCGNIAGPLERNLLLLKASSADEVVASQPVHVAASGIAFPHPEKVMQQAMRGVNHRNSGHGGEDAYFYCTGRNGIFGMGVADGVYMWKEVGIDSGTFSRTLMETARHMVQAGCEDVYKVLQVAARHVESEGVQGSSTACLLTVNLQQGRLHAANLGDSGFFVIGKQGNRDQLAIKFRTSQLEHEFGCPFQLGHHRAANKPEDADLATFPVQKGDVIVMGTDGLLDNVSETEIVSEVERARREGESPGQLMQRLSKLAFDNSIDKKRSTPYSKAATEAFEMVYSGGKPDDITVLVAYLD